MNFRYIYRAELNPDLALASAFEKSSNPKQRDTRLIVDSMTLPPKFRIGLIRPGSGKHRALAKWREEAAISSQSPLNARRRCVNCSRLSEWAEAG